MPVSSQGTSRGWFLTSSLLGIPLTIAFLILGACGGGKPVATPTPTRTPRPAATSVKAIPTVSLAIPIATATLILTPTEIPATPTSPPPTAAPTATAAPPTARPTVPPSPAPPTKAPPTAAPPPPTSPPPAPDPCANIGGDGCKWRVTGGPATAANGGQELKIQLLFIHSGVEGGQPQGSYFIVLEKDGRNLGIPDSVRSVARAASQGALGRYNYEYTLGLDKLPGATVAGGYTLWVLDGNGERDSRNITFSVPANQGLLWIQFDQN